MSLFWIGTLLSAAAAWAQAFGLSTFATLLAWLGDGLRWQLPLGATAFTVWALVRFDRIAGGSER